MIFSINKGETCILEFVFFSLIGWQNMFKGEVTYYFCCFSAEVRHFTDAMTVKLTILSITEIILPLERNYILSAF